MPDSEHDDGKRQIAKKLWQEEKSCSKQGKGYLADQVKLAALSEEYRCCNKEDSGNGDSGNGGSGNVFERACRERQTDSSHDAVDKANEHGESYQADAVRRCFNVRLTIRRSVLRCRSVCLHKKNAG